MLVTELRGAIDNAKTLTPAQARVEAIEMIAVLEPFLDLDARAHAVKQVADEALQGLLKRITSTPFDQLTCDDVLGLINMTGSDVPAESISKAGLTGAMLASCSSASELLLILDLDDGYILDAIMLLCTVHNILAHHSIDSPTAFSHVQVSEVLSKAGSPKAADAVSSHHITGDMFLLIEPHHANAILSVEPRTFLVLKQHVHAAMVSRGRRASHASQ